MVHSEIAAVPAERLKIERQVLRPLPSLRPPLRRGELRKVDWLATARFGSARSRVPAQFESRRSTRPGSQLLFRFIAVGYERRAIGLAPHHPFENWDRLLPEQATAAALLGRLLHHAIVATTEGDAFHMREAKTGTNTGRKEAS